jgi:CMP-N-acetylneuraminate monooxygenase
LNNGLKLKIKWENISDGAHFIKDKKLILYKKDNELKICLNKCKHQGNQFIESKSPHKVICSAHGWELDLEQMKYVNPRGIDLYQELLKSTILEDTIEVFYNEGESGTFANIQKCTLEKKEFTITHYSHATAEIKCGDFKIITDPWCEGPAFTTGWWLTQTPPHNWLQKIAKANLIFISHSHSDHLNIYTLKKIKKLNRGIKIIIPFFKNYSCDNLLSRIGFTNVNRVPFTTWQSIDKHCRYMVLKDYAGKNDSGILIEYKGHRVLNMVDSHNLNNGELPIVDVLMASFASGSSGYPVCWENYSLHEKNKIITQKRKYIRNKIIKALVITKPKVFVPFAGYFNELHPSDNEIFQINKKNTPEEIEQEIARNSPQIKVWSPIPNQYFDFSNYTLKNNTKTKKQNYEFENYDQLYLNNPYYNYFNSLKSIQDYFDWAGYRDDRLTLHVIETDQLFRENIREFYVNFKTGKVYQRMTLNGGDHYLRMKVKSHIFRYVLAYGLGWEDISIGFQARFFRNPDIYNRGFWAHFQENLPHKPIFKDLYKL